MAVSTWASMPSPVSSPTSARTPPPATSIAFVRQLTGSTASGTTFDVPIASNAGDALVAAIAIQAGTTASVTRVTDTAGNTWTKGPIGLQSGSSTRIELWYSTGAASVSNVTVTLSVAKAASANVSEYRGVARTSALDVSAGTGNALSTTAGTPTITTTIPGDLVVAAINYPGSATSTLTGTAYTALSNFTATVNGRAAYRIATAAGTSTAIWTLSSAAASGGAIIALKAGT